MAAKKKAEGFSVTKTVKANARERLGQPKPERVLKNKTAVATRKAKYKQKLGDAVEAEP